MSSRRPSYRIPPTVSRKWFLPLLPLFLATPLLAGAQSLPAVTTPTATTTALNVTPAAPASAPIPDYTVETLTATVSTSGGVLKTGGTVNFFDTATVPSLLGSAQINTAGVAVLRVTPGVGSHGFQAQFQGTNAASKSATSAQSTVVVYDPYYEYVRQDFATILSGAPSGYTLATKVVLYGTGAVPTGTIALKDTSNNNQQVGPVLPLNPFNGSIIYNGTRTPTPTNPLTATAGDFNEDGYPDVAFTNSLNDGSAGTMISVALNNANEYYDLAALGQPIKVGSYPLTLTVGDFNADGHLDIATANLGDNTVTVLLGKGDGTFPTVMAPVAVGANPFSLVTADFNRDGKLDLAVANLGGGTVSILLGQGDGKFVPAAKPTLLAGNAPDALAAADFDRNGTIDLVVTNGNDNTVTVYFGDGTGGFSNGMILPAGPAPASVLAADFNGDGYPDLAIVNQTTHGTVSILLNTTTGSFSNPVSYPVGSTPYSIVAGDLLGHGLLDLAVCNEGDDTVAILPGGAAGTGSFNPTITIQPRSINTGNVIPRGMASITLADFNGDGKPDLLAPNYGNQFGAGSTAVVLFGARTSNVVQTGITVSGPGTHPIESLYTYNFSDYTSGSIGNCCYDLVAPLPASKAPPKVITPTRIR